MRTELVTTLKRKATKLLSELESERAPILITQHGLPAAYLVDGFLWVLVAARLRARVQLSTLFGVYSCSLRALQRYRSSSPKWGHFSAVSSTSTSGTAPLAPA